MEEHLKFDFPAAVYRALLVGHTGLGVAILVGGAARFPLPTYKPLLELTGGDVLPWGVSILVSALLMTLHGWWVNMVGLGIGLGWMSTFSTMFFWAYSDPTSASTAPIPYAVLGMIIVALMTLKIAERAAQFRAYKSTTAMLEKRG